MKFVYGKFSYISLGLICLLTLAASTEFNTHLKTEANFKINLSEKKMKHQMKNKNDPTQAIIEATSSSSTGAPGVDDLPPGPIYFKGWAKYVHFRSGKFSNDFPSSFYQNNEFYEQLKYNITVPIPSGSAPNSADPAAPTPTGPIDPNAVKGPLYFYAMLFKDNLNFISSPREKLQTTYDTLSISRIMPVSEKPGFSAKDNGIVDFGNFNEGFCLKVICQGEMNWVICLDTLAEKTNLMMRLKQLKIKSQREQGMVEIPDEANPFNLNPFSPDTGSTSELKGSKVTLDEDADLKDGYWVVLQNWTPCSLKCGGGTSTLQRMCVPPKEGGKDCEGEAILTKKCNEQPCPDIKKTRQNNATKEETPESHPTVKILPFSSRPQRYTKCIVKESDLFYSQNLEEARKPSNPYTAKPGNKIDQVKLPTRVVMNNSTISIFAGDSYTSMIVSFPIKATQFSRSGNDKSCFFLSNGEKTAELCPFGSDGGNMVEEWDYDFHMFKDKCHPVKTKKEINLQDEMNKSLNEKIKNAKQQVILEQEKNVKNKIEADEVEDLKVAFKKTNEIALKAIQKELDLEAMIKEEEYEREQEEQKEMIQKVEEERKKSDMLMKAIREKQIENQFNIRAEETKHDIENVKKEVVNTVNVKRKELKQKIMDMRKKAQRKKAEIASELKSIRVTVSNTVTDAYKIGNGEKCMKGRTEDKVRLAYCQTNVVGDLDRFSTCNDANEYCIFCCDNEFGSMYQDKRQECYRQNCQSEPVVPSKPAKMETGEWVWVKKEAKA